MDPWAILGVPEGADVETIKTAYRQLARAFHPDVNADPAAVEHFRRITEAYLALCDPRWRAAHSRSRTVGSESEMTLGLRVAGIGLGGVLGVSVRMRTRPLFADDLDEDEQPLQQLRTRRK